MEETPWSERREGLVAALLLQASTTGIICLQEVLHGQLQDISSLLNNSNNNTATGNDASSSASDAKKWEYVGVGRDDGATRGEYSPIFYNTEVHELISWRCFWLSETPDRPGKGWDAASVRICTVGRFGFKGSGKHDFTIMVIPLFPPPFPHTILDYVGTGMLAHLLFSPPTLTTRVFNPDTNRPSSFSMQSTLNFRHPHASPRSFSAVTSTPRPVISPTPLYPLGCTTCVSQARTFTVIITRLLDSMENGVI